jgi:hypothetical protein
MRRCLLRAVLLKAARRMRRMVLGDIKGRHVGRHVGARRRIMKKSTWQWLSGASLGTVVGVGLLTLGLSPLVVAGVGLVSAFAINKFELE